MATVINNPSPDAREDRGIGFVVGLILAIVVLVLLFAYGIPALRGSNRSSGTQVNIPDKMNINVNGGTSGGTSGGTTGGTSGQ